MEADAAQFSAFVSYSHADAAIAKKLHRKIETYKLPKLLRAIGPGGKESGRSDGRLGQIFRDREDLPAALDLSESVKAALAQSRALIVLCSPHAKDSPWVAKEIELFRELHPDRPILAALIDGEPDEAFPPALLISGEPLAADLRKSGDGWRLGLLKLVAGVAEVPLDALVQRDSQRHIRSVMTVTLVVGIALLAMIGMTAYAIQQRNAAQHQQAQAEGLVEFMLTDLRERLKSVGRLDIMGAVNKKTMEYCKAQRKLSNPSTSSLSLCARNLHAWGEDDEKRDDLDKALEKFTEAHRVTEELLVRDSENPDRIYAHAQSEYWVGYAAWRGVKLDVARPHFQNYAKLSEKLLSIDNENLDWIMEAGYSQSNLATLMMRGDGAYNEAATIFQKSLDYFNLAERLNPTDNSIKREIADAHAWISDAVRAAGHLQRARFHRDKEAQILIFLKHSDPENAVYQSDLLGNARGTAQIEMDLGKFQDARARLNQALDSARQMTAKFPANTKLKKQMKALELFLVRATLLDQSKPLDRTSNLILSNCTRSSDVQSEPELMAFCKMLNRSIGRNIKGADFVSPYPKMRLSPRWGIDFGMKKANFSEGK